MGAGNQGRALAALGAVGAAAVPYYFNLKGSVRVMEFATLLAY
jgi:hypothetical protein